MLKRCSCSHKSRDEVIELINEQVGKGRLQGRVVQGVYKASDCTLKRGKLCSVSGSSIRRLLLISPSLT